MNTIKKAAMHTPGPWTTQPIGDETECNILGSRRELVATVSDNDACLIAASPDLLQSLKDAVEDLVVHHGAHEADLARYRTVIEKAEGK